MNENGHIAKLMRQPSISKSEVSNLLRAWQLKGDVKARNKAVMAYMPAVAKLARKYGKHYDGKLDLINEGVFGVMRAADSFNLDGETQFGTWATLWARDCIIQFTLRQKSNLYVSYSSMSRIIAFNLDRQKRKLGITNGELTQNDAEALAKAFACSTEMLMCVVNAVGPQISTDYAYDSSDGDGFSMAKFLASDRPTPEEIAERDDMLQKRRRVIAGAMASLKPNAQDIIKRLYLCDEPEKIADIGKDHGVTHQAISLTHHVALEKIKKYARSHRV